MNRPCNYGWQHPGQSDQCDEGSPIALLNWLLQPDLESALPPTSDIDRVFSTLVLRIVTEQGLSFEQVLEDYFCNIHSWLPVVLERSFRDRVSNLKVEPCAETSLLFLAIFLLMQRDRDKRGEPRPSQNYILSKHFYSFLQLRRAPSLRLVQCALLTSLYEIGSLSPETASLSISNCARLGYLMKLNLDDGSEYTDYLAWEAAEERRRVWVGVYLLDRYTTLHTSQGMRLNSYSVVYQVVTEFKAPHAVEDLANHFRLPVDDTLLKQPELGLVQGTFNHPMSVPVDVPLCYYARGIQAVRLLGEVQTLQRQADIETMAAKFESLDRRLMQFAERLFEQTPRGWAVLCGANAITIM